MIDGDKALARGSNGAHTRLVRLHGQWRIDGREELDEQAARGQDA